MQQLSLFQKDDTTATRFPEVDTNKPSRPRGGSRNPIVFHDYESYVAKFRDKEKTTDDTFTPPDVYEAVLKYVGEVFPLDGRPILRPFYPGGDFEHAEYPPDGVVVDNPPFSIFMKCVRFFVARGIPFFLFGPGMTIFSCAKYCTAVIISRDVTFHNGANVRVNFASNLFGDLAVTTAPRLDDLIAVCPSQNVKKNLPKYEYPTELLAVSDMQSICAGGVEFAVRRAECVRARNLDNHPKRGGLFGDHLFISTAKGRAKERAKERARNVFPVPLSERERRIVESLGNHQE